MNTRSEPARSTKCSLEDNDSPALLDSLKMMVKMACDREETRFMSVLFVVLHREPF